MKKVAAVLTLALAVTLAELAYAQDNAASPDPGLPVNVFNQTPQPSGWANPSTRGPYESVNYGGDAESPSVAVPAAPIDSGTTLSQSSGDDNSGAASGNEANGAGWRDSDSNATGGDNGGSDSTATSGSDAGESDRNATDAGDNGDSNSTATSGSDTGDSDSSASGADDSAGAGEMSNGSGDGDSNASSDSDSDTTSGESGDNSTDSGGSDASSSDSADSGGWK